MANFGPFSIFNPESGSADSHTERAQWPNENKRARAFFADKMDVFFTFSTSLLLICFAKKKVCH